MTCGEKLSKYSKILIFQRCFLDICGLINNLKTFNKHNLMLVGTFIDTLV